MENEIMNYDEVMDSEIEAFEIEESKSGISTGVAVLIGAGLTLAITAAVKQGKKWLANRKAKKELHLVEEDKVVEPTDEQIAEVTQK